MEILKLRYYSFRSKYYTAFDQTKSHIPYSLLIL